MAEVDINTKVSRRKQLIASLSLFTNYLQTSGEQLNESQIRIRLSKLEDCWNEFQEVQSTIEMLDSSDSHLEIRDSFENDYYHIVACAQDILLDFKNKSSRREPSSPSNNVQHSIKLPEIKLPSFKGQYDEWLSFHDIFVSIIHSNNALTDIQKLYYLRSALEGEAREVIQSLELTTSNYLVAWKLLLDRYHNTTHIIQKHVKSLLNLEKVERESPTALRRLLDSALKHTRALEALNQPVEHWDAILVPIITSNFDQKTFRDWQTTTTRDQLPTLSDVTNFLHRRCSVLDSLQVDGIKSKVSTLERNKQGQNRSTNQGKPSFAYKYNSLNMPSQHSRGFNSFVSTSRDPSKQVRSFYCEFCHENSHIIFKCPKFLKLSVNDRFAQAQTLNLCTNCLKVGHKPATCLSSSCRMCKDKYHNTVLCNKNKVQFNSRSESVPTTSKDIGHISLLTNRFNNSIGNNTKQILLSTALIDVVNHLGNKQTARALLDSASQASFITESFCQHLGLKRNPVNYPVTGINSSQTQVTNQVYTVIHSRAKTYQFDANLLVLPRITGELPSSRVSISDWKFHPSIVLADSNFNVPSHIDLLIGADIFWDLIESDQCKINNSVQLRESKLGWLVSGPVSSDNRSGETPTACHLTTLERLDHNLQRFWQLEEIILEPTFSGEDRLCEDHYKETVTRSENGRYIVQYPLRLDPSNLGDSKSIALRRFYALERRLCSNKQLQKSYYEFMDEYIQLGHMKCLSGKEIDSLPPYAYFVPHHAVFKDSSTTTKLRVVFDASTKTSNGLSLNDISLPGPVLQQDIFSISCRFRTHSVVYCADIEKMYRQILMHDNHTSLQLIFWRKNPTQPLNIYSLKTVTYGTTSAPYLAKRTLQQLAYDERSNYPEASTTALEDFYMDDLMSGCESVTKAIEIYSQLNNMLHKGGFHLRKWNSNCPELLKLIPDSDKLQQHSISLDNEAKYKTLGLLWNPVSDTFSFSINLAVNISQDLTKRNVLSAIAQIFDPLGFLAPIIVRGKLFMQKLWAHKLDWDTRLPQELLIEWTNYYNSLYELNNLSIPRMIHSKSCIASRMEIHGFSDASEKAYGACLYLRSVDTSNNITIRLIASKSRVAPLKSTTLPRLELCGAVLLSELYSLTVSAQKLTIKDVYFWTDSTIVLAWLSAPSSHWNTFVRNRVAKIQSLTNVNRWRHIKGCENPADLVSRGINGTQLIHSELWWNGPPWLSQHERPWIEIMPITIDRDLVPERKQDITVLANTLPNNHFSEVIKRFSSFSKLCRIAGYCLRFIKNTRPLMNSKKVGHLSAAEIRDGTNLLIKAVQQEMFPQDLVLLQQNQEIKRNSNLRFLCPFLDKDGIIRVGGRLDNAHVSYSQKHPTILPKHHFTNIMFKYEHDKTHSGAQSLLNFIRMTYWPVNGRNLSKRIVHECPKCYRLRPKPLSQLMGSLPTPRVTPNRPFTNCGVDYCGPIYFKRMLQKRSAPVKAYIALFICLCTKAIHIELVTDLTTSAFIAALKRFIGRRGVLRNIHSDNATTFVAADKQLQDLFNTLKDDNINNDLYNFVATSESYVNSRPLCAISDDPSDLLPLTPSHFLIGEPFHSLTEPDLTYSSSNLVDRWQQTQRLSQLLWKRWSTEYLSSLQERHKWTHKNPSVEPDTLVLLKEDNNPPLTWKLARVVSVHPGSDGAVRVVTCKTSNGILKRPIVRICPLPKMTAPSSA